MPAVSLTRRSSHCTATTPIFPFHSILHCAIRNRSPAAPRAALLANAKAPIDAVGLCLNAAAGDCGLVDYYSSPQFTNDPASTPVPVSKQNVHWIVNDLTAAQHYGTPFAGSGRNLQRGDSINTANLALLKNFRIGERLTLETRAIAYNIMNRQYRGTPGSISTLVVFLKLADRLRIPSSMPTGIMKPMLLFPG